jgi:TolB-like protein
MKIRVGIVFLFFISIVLLHGQPIVITVNDFVVESNNPSYEYIGKGISRLVASELGKSDRVKLVERENLQKVLKEQELSLSDLADQETQVKVGMLLSAEYVVMGEIIDMVSVILLSLRMVDVETGEIVWQDGLQEKLNTYDYIGAYFASSILQTLGAQTEEATLVKLEKKEQKNEEAIVKLSEGIDAYDRGDKEKAKRELKQARSLDPVNEVAREFLSKLESVSPKFRVETELYSSSYNPASLGFLENDVVFAWNSTVSNPPNVTVHPDRSEDQLTGDYWASNHGNSEKIGYALPIGKRLGLAAEFVRGGYRWLAAPEDELVEFDNDGTPAGEVKDSFTNIGASVSLGYRLLDNLSIGTTVMLWNTAEGPGTTVTVDPGIYWAAGGGFMVKALEDALAFDVQVMYTSQSMYYGDTQSMEILKGVMPLLTEASLTYELVSQVLFLGLKGIGSIYIDERGGHALRIIPVVEYRPLAFLSLRAGYEYSHFSQADQFVIGHGFLAGIGVKVWRLDLNANLTYSQVPARLLPGYTVKSLTTLFGATFTPQLLSR